MTMKAVQLTKFGGVENLIVKTDVPIPKPAADEVLIKVKAAGINPLDTYYREGTFDPALELPYTPGCDGAGIIEEVGAEVKHFKKGDRVIVVLAKTGTYAEYCTAKAAVVGKLHESISFTDGAAIGIPYYTAYAAIFDKAKTKPGETVLVHGASGAVGVAAVQMLKAHGCKVIGTAGTDKGLKLVQELGADKVFNHNKEGYMVQMRSELTEGQGVGVILEMLANVNLQMDLEIVTSRGRIVIIGSRGSIEIVPLLLMLQESSIHSVALLHTRNDEWGPMHEHIYEGQKTGWLKPRVSTIYKMEDAGQGQHDVIHNSGKTGKLVIDTSL